MEDEGGKDWEIEEYSPSGGDRKVMGRLIRRGLRIGKTIVLTGVVISSAPFVLPPLMVVSAVGLACSVPFGVFVASYACAEKLMSKLLPMPKPPPPLPLMLEYKGFSQADEVSYIDEEGMQMDEEENETVSEDNYYQGKELMEEQMVEQGYEEDDENLAQEETQSMNISSNETHPLVQILRQERPIDNVRDEDLDLEQSTHEDITCTVIEVEGPYGLTIGAVEQTTDRKEAADADQGEQSMNEATDVKSSETPAVVQSVGETYGLREEKLDNQTVAAADANGTAKRRKKSKKKKAKSGETSKEEPARNFHPEELENETASNADVGNTTDRNRLNLPDDKVAAVDEVNPSINAAGVVHPTESGPTSRNSSGRSFKASPNKELFSEEKIWEHIEALRTIVGYKVARQETCMEELKALYIFTGVEPPVSFGGSPDLRDSSDLVEVNDKLRFLMAIVGVK